MHPKAKSHLVYLLRTALSECEANKGLVNTWTEGFAGVRAVASKQVGEWLSDSDVNSIVGEGVQKQFGSDSEKASGPLSKLLKPEVIGSVSEQIADFIASLPRTYRVLFPLPNVAISSEVRLTEAVSIVRTAADKKEGSIAGLYAMAMGSQRLPKPDATYISVLGKGYASWNMRQSAIKDAASKMKRVLQVAIAKNALLPDWRRGPGLSLAAVLGSPSASILQAAVTDETDKSVGTIAIQLPLGMSVWLQKLVIYDGTGDGPQLTLPLFSASHSRVRHAARFSGSASHRCSNCIGLT